MDVIREHFTDAQWDGISERARLAIERADFKSLTARFVRDIKVKAFKRLEAGKKLNITTLCNGEIERLALAGKISTRGAPGFFAKFLEQVTGAVSVKKDKQGLRLYLSLGDRVYQARAQADPESWIKQLGELAEEEGDVSDRLRKWIAALQIRHPDLTPLQRETIEKILADRATRSAT